MNIEIKRYKNNNTFDKLEYYYVPIVNGKEYSFCFLKQKT